jgi:hypothetical protein
MSEVEPPPLALTRWKLTRDLKREVAFTGPRAEMQAGTTDVLTRRAAAMRGWRRLGVVLSVFWFVGFGWWLLPPE